MHAIAYSAPWRSRRRPRPGGEHVPRARRRLRRVVRRGAARAPAGAAVQRLPRDRRARELRAGPRRVPRAGAARRACSSPACSRASAIGASC
ncbi:MAG: hypothetical protein MZW92_32335 [Comamonadaceae bacterium]|nr:hypothetical protein [Comamonadaceae bacterium]